jgi:hypothetical protein
MKKPLILFIVLTSALGINSLFAEGERPLNDIAKEYVKLALAVGAYAPGYIDAYYGPREWTVKDATPDQSRAFPAAEFRKKAAAIVQTLKAAARDKRPELERLRVEFLDRQMTALKAEIDMRAGTKFSFDRESQLFYDAVAPVHGRAGFEKTIAALESALPGKGSLRERLDALKKEYVIPAEKLAAVFDAAIAECRRRTLAHIALPPGESFKAEYVKDKPWGAYNWYKGSAFSLIEINTDLPMRIDSPLRLAAHEGYPGHHVYNALLEQKLVKEKGWIEFTVYPLASPQSLIAEGTANYGIELIFPGRERLQFEKEVLYPLAGLDPQKADRYDRVQELLGQLRYAENEAARGYLDGRMSKAEALEWLARYAMEPPERAAKTIDFFDRYRSYVINYNLGQDIVQAYIEKTAGRGASLERKWRVFYEILSTPRTPSGLRRQDDK